MIWQELGTIKTEYKKKHKRELVDDIKDDTSGEFRDLLVELCKGERDQGTAVDKKLAKDDAKKLHKVCWSMKGVNCVGHVHIVLHWNQWQLYEGHQKAILEIGLTYKQIN